MFKLNRQINEKENAREMSMRNSCVFTELQKHQHNKHFSETKQSTLKKTEALLWMLLMLDSGVHIIFILLLEYETEYSTRSIMDFFFWVTLSELCCSSHVLM